MKGGKAFTQPLPFVLGTNGIMMFYNFVDTFGLAAAQTIGMGVWREGVPWNYSVSGGLAGGIESTPGTYNTGNIVLLASIVADIKAAGMKPLLALVANQSPSLCPYLGAPLTSGTVYTSINISSGEGALAFAITSGDSIQLTNGPGGSTQTVVAAANMAVGASGSLAVTSFTANANYAAGAWVYDTAWVACTPQHFATMASHLVAQTGLQGLDWELLNEPDGEWGTSAAMLTQMYKLTYSAMKAADPTCTIHGVVTQSMCGTGFGYGMDYYNNCVASGILTGNGSGGPCYDVLSAHIYGETVGFTGDWAAPMSVGAFNYTMPQLVANWKANMVAKGDTSNLWITEFGYQYTSDGPMTPYLQAQYYLDFLNALSGYDPLNGVPFSSYLKVMCNYALTNNGGSNWAVYPNDENPPNPAAAVLIELVSGH